MRTAIEIALAGSLAVGLHLGAFALTRSAPAGTAGAGGEGGADRVSVRSADAAMAALVETYATLVPAALNVKPFILRRPPSTSRICAVRGLTMKSPLEPPMSAQ